MANSKQQQTVSKHTHGSGATSSHLAPEYATSYIGFWSRIARRFGLGTQYHGRGNWRRCYSKPTLDVAFLRDRYNHAVNHLLSLQFGTKNDDHLAAVGWFVSIAIEAEEVYGVDWYKVLMVETPEHAAERIKHNNYFTRRQTP